MPLKRFVERADLNVTTVLRLPNDESDCREVVSSKFPTVFCRIGITTDFGLILPYVFASLSFLCPASWLICLHHILCWFPPLFHFHFYRFRNLSFQSPDNHILLQTLSRFIKLFIRQPSHQTGHTGGKSCRSPSAYFPGRLVCPRSKWYKFTITQGL